MIITYPKKNIYHTAKSIVVDIMARKEVYVRPHTKRHGGVDVKGYYRSKPGSSRVYVHNIDFNNLDNLDNPGEQRTDTISIRVRDPEDFEDNAITLRSGETVDFATKDVGRPGGMKYTVGKLRREIRTAEQRDKPIKDVPTRVQRILLSKQDFTVHNGKLIPITTRGRRELIQIRNDYGTIEHKGGDTFRISR